MAEQSKWDREVAEIWAILKDVAQRFRETDEKFRETDEKFRETDKKFRETDKKFEKTREELDRLFRETDEKFRKTDEELRKISRMVGDLTNHWGRFLENILAPNLVEELQKFGLPIQRLFLRPKARLNGQTLEIDLLATGDGIVVAVEVKTTLKTRHVENFLGKLKHFGEFFPEYKGYTLYGGVGGLELVDGVETYALRQGLFVIAARGGLAELLVPEGFRPRTWQL